MKKMRVLMVLFILLISMIPINAAPVEGVPTDLKAAFVSPRGSDIERMETVWKKESDLKQYYSEIKSIGGTTANTELGNVDLKDFDIIILDGLAYNVILALEETINAAKENGTKVYVNGNEGAYIKTDIETTYEAKILTYLNFPMAENNYKNMMTYLAYLEMKESPEKTELLADFVKSGAETAPKTPSIYGIYHPAKWDTDREFFSNVDEYLEWYDQENIDGKTHVYDPAVPTIGVIPTTSYNRIDRDRPILDYFIEEIESQGYNVIVGTYVTANHANNRNSFIGEDGEVKIDVAISLTRGGRFYGSAGRANDGVAELENLDVPVLTAVQLYQNISQEEWEASAVGLMPDQHYQLALAEMDGMIEPIVVAAKPTVDGKTIDRNEPIEYQADWMVQRAAGWANLATKDNGSKKIVIPYYSAEAGRSNVGADPDYYLNAPASILKILQELKSNGYDVGENVPAKGDTAAEEEFMNTLIEEMTQNGYNAGTWAPGQLEKLAESGKAHLLPVAEYEAYFNAKINTSKQKEVTDLWGEAPGEIMVYKNQTGEYFVIPAIEYGNVMLTPTPLRGRDQTQDARAHDNNYPPTHQALAVYYFINEEYDADAMLPLWTNLATMPGKEAGLAADDWTALMIQDTPIIHVLPMDATGLTDRRRGNMLVINFMTPALVQSGLYGDLYDLETHIADFGLYSASRSETLKMIREICAENGVADALNIDWDAAEADEEEARKALRQLSKQLRSIKNSYIPYGDHILGVAPEGEELAAMIASMVSQHSSIDTQLNSVFLTDEEREEAKVQIIGKMIDGKTAAVAINETLEEMLEEEAANVEVSAKNGIENALSAVNTYKTNIQSCTDEMSSLMDALDGKYITPGPNGDPIKKPEALPTGRNPYPADPREIPTQGAYTMGARLAEDLIDLHLEKNKVYPEKIAFLLWAVEASRTGGINEGEIMNLMGIKPKWNTNNSRVLNTTFEVISRETLDRPRVDVIVEVSGSYRDTYAQQIAYINLAAKMASEQEEEDNPVRKNSLAIYEMLRADKNLTDKYTDDELWTIACTRVFGPAPGEYTPGIENLAGSENGNEQTAAEAYLKRMSYMYVTFTNYEEGKAFKTETWNWGEEHMENVLKSHLKEVDMGVFSRSSEVYGLLDHPMVASYFGGLAAAIKASGGNADMYINNLRSGVDEVQTLSEFLTTDLNSRYFNPKWIEGMMNSGYAGTAHMNEFFEAMAVWQTAMPELITESMMKNMYDIYVNDSLNKGVTEHLKNTNPYAYQGMVANLLNSIYNGEFEASDEIRKQLEKEYVEQTAVNGVVCCHHTCGNMKFNAKIVEGLTSLELENSVKNTYLKEINAALDQSFKMPQTTSSGSGSGTGNAIVVNSTDNNSSGTVPVQTDEAAGSGVGRQDTPAGTSSPQVSGFEMITQSAENAVSDIRDFIANPSVSTSSMIAIALVILVIGAVFYGFRRKSI